MIKRLVILSEIIAPYRIPVFNALARHQGIDLHVIFLAETDSGLRQWLVYKDEIGFSYQVLTSRRQRLGGHNILLNRGLKDSLRQAAPDAIICGGYNYLASWQAKSWARSHRVPFILWVESTDKDRRSGNRLLEFLKTRFMRDCSAFVVPGKSSFEYVKKYRTPGNTSLRLPTRLTLNFLPNGRQPYVRMPLCIARLCACLRVFSVCG